MAEPSRKLNSGDPFNPFGNYGVWQRVRASSISPGAKLLYEALRYRAGKNGDCYPKIATLAIDVGVSPRRVQQCLKELEQCRLIRRVASHSQRARQTSNRYEFLWAEIFESKDESRRKPTAGKPKIGVQEAAASPVQDPAPLGMKDSALPPRRILHPYKEESINHHHQEESSLRVRQNSDPVTDRGNFGKSPHLRTPNNHASFPDDDDSKPPKYASAKDELIAICEQGASPLTETVVRRIGENLELRGHTWEELLEPGRKGLQNTRLTNPAGFLTDLSKNLGGATKSASWWLAPAPPVERCNHCGEPYGRGLVISELGKDVIPCPKCATPEWETEWSTKEAERAVTQRTVSSATATTRSEILRE